jgi:hypothetical protein
LVDVALVVAAVCLVIGFWTRTASIAVLCCLVVLCNTNPIIFNGGDSLLRHLAVVIALAPAGAGLSLDRRLARGASGEGWACPPRPVWPLRLVQIQVAVMYVAAVAHKLGGTTWWDGTAASYPLRIEAVTRFPVFADVAGSPLVALLLTWGTLVVEAAIPLLVWNRKTRPWVLALGVCLHLALGVTLRAGLFSWVVLVAYLAFVPPETMAAVFALLRLPGHREGRRGSGVAVSPSSRPTLRRSSRRHTVCS